MIGALLERHVPGLLIAVVVALMSWFGKTVVQGQEESAKLGAQLSTVVQMVGELRQDQKASIEKMGTIGAQIGDLNRRVGNVESIMVYRNQVDPVPHK